MIFAAARLWCHDLRRSTSNFLADLFWMLIRVDSFSLRKPGGKFHMSCFQLALAPEGRCKQTCLYNRVLISKDDSNIYLIRFTFEKDEDRGSAFCVVL